MTGEETIRGGITGPFGPLTLVQRGDMLIGLEWRAGPAPLTPLLIAEGLADEVVLLVFPVMIGRGKRIFSDAVDPSELKLVDSRATSTGVVISTSPGTATA